MDTSTASAAGIVGDPMTSADLSSAAETAVKYLRRVVARGTDEERELVDVVSVLSRLASDLGTSSRKT